ncbi:hypothetical protein BDY24DRAFT_383197 [Mrakia frigida]|uniref:uncharacterized protein n=1 Tax=Mrakia frigida TaxID=29902 RepID=UPI003FCBEECB
MSMGMTHQPNFTLLLLPLPSSSSSSSSPSLTIQLTPAPSSPPLSLLTPLNTSNLFHRLPVSMLSAANIVSHLVENTRIGTAVQYAERRIREFARLSAEADPEFWAGTRESAEEVMGSLVGGGGGKLEEGELGTYRKREVGKGNKGKLSSSSSSIPSEDKDKDDKEDDGSSFEADFLATATASSSPFPPLSSSSISPTTPTSTERTNLSFLFKTRTRTTTTSSSSFDDDDNSFWTLPSTSDVQENNPFRPNWIGSKPLQPMFRLPQGSLPDALDEGEEELEEEEEEGMVKLGTEEELEVEVREGGKGKVVMDPERELRQLMDLVKAGRGGRG